MFGLSLATSSIRSARRLAPSMDATTVMGLALLIGGIILQLALLLSVSRSPAATLGPAALQADGADGACVMFCVETDTAAAEMAPPAASSADRPDDVPVRLAASDSPAPSAVTCWMFCNEIPPRSGAGPGWTLPLAAV